LEVFAVQKITAVTRNVASLEIRVTGVRGRVTDWKKRTLDAWRAASHILSETGKKIGSARR
jgi:hypothetical protein